MKRGDAVQTPRGVGQLWLVQGEWVVAEMDYQHRSLFRVDQVEVLEDE